MATRISSASLYAGVSLSTIATVRMSSASVYAAIPVGTNTRISSIGAFSAQGWPGPSRVSSVSIFVAIALGQRDRFAFLQGGQIFGVDLWTYTTNPYLVPELNPYRPSIPDEFLEIGDVFYDFQRETQEIIRQQHNINQTGDSTYPFQVILGSHTDKKFTLGSVGRFYHENYGLIQARYVQFKSMTEANFVSAPVGLLRKSSSLDWKVTNDFTLSDPDLVVGLLSTYELPANDSYGWVIVDGTNISEVDNSLSTGYVQGETLTWAATGKIANNTIGRILGRRVNLANSTRMSPGSFKVQLESLSHKDIEALISTTMAEIEELLVEIQEDLTQLGSLTGLPAQLTAALASINTLTTRIALEETTRAAADAAIRSQINNLDLIEQSDIDAAIANVNTSVGLVDARLTASIDAIILRLNDIEASIAALPVVDLTPLNDAIVAILIEIAQLKARPIGILPLVDGSVPPNLMYLDDGNLVWIEVYNS